MEIFQMTKVGDILIAKVGPYYDPYKWGGTVTPYKWPYI